MESPAPRAVPIGLSSEEAARRLLATGPNEIRRASGTPAWKMLVAQLSSPLVLLLLAACLVSIASGDLIDSAAIAAIVVLNAAIGVWQEYSAQNAILALRAMTAPRARVLRDGASVVLPAREVVPGDVLILEAGDIVAADARLLEANLFSTNEAALTGESLPVDKSAAPSPDAPPADRRDHVFLGTHATAGTATALVTATGMGTELGRIAHLLETAEDGATPLQIQLARLGRALLWLCLAVVAAVAAARIAQGEGWFDTLMLAVPLAVAAVPEGLPAIVTIALAIGVQRMATRNVLVRKLPAVETLGAATVVCTDKTGTLTTGEMSVRELWGPDHGALLAAAAACCDAEIHRDGTAVGDPTEVAILHAAFTRGITRDGIEAANPRREVRPFDPVRKRMSIRRADGRLYVKGAADHLVPLCTTGTAGVHEASADLAGRGLRVLAVAVGRGPEERDLALLGLLALADPPRTEAIEAIAAARRAGITTVMITGDHPVTAASIAREMGIVEPGEDLEGRVYARVTPEQKLDIVREWKARGAIVAMTGDGVNDAPALREAHVGIAMGRTGTEVSREAADLVLADDDFASIVAGIREGRGIWENIRKTVVYLLAGNLGELLAVFGATAFGMPSPFLPLQILWINLATDGLPALALVMDPAPADALDRPPRPPDQPLLGRREWMLVVVSALMQCTVVLGSFVWALHTQGLDVARNLAFSVIVFEELLRVFAARSPDRTFWEVGALSNVKLIAVVLGSAALQIGMLQLPAVQALFHVSPLTWQDSLLAVALGLVPVTALEGFKILRRRAA